MLDAMAIKASFNVAPALNSTSVHKINLLFNYRMGLLFLIPLPLLSHKTIFCSSFLLDGKQI
jgi:hypothetical protein